ncbi:MAG TPA: phage protein Gp37 [Candidatus Xenobia bacterium]|nr:phage protein Gp37 [Candidatus Xenobia bacterium]
MNLAALETALLNALRAHATLSYLRTLEPVSERTFDSARGDFIVVPPAVLSFFLGSQLRARDLAARTYDYNPRLLLFAVARNLRGEAEEKRGGPAPAEVGAYTLLHDLKTALAGARLELSNGSAPVVELAGESLEAATPEYSVYSLEVLLRGSFHA